MIDLKRNSKGELVAAKGYRVRSNTIYKPGQKDDFKISRSKFEDFLKCQLIFLLKSYLKNYLDHDLQKE